MIVSGASSRHRASASVAAAGEVVVDRERVDLAAVFEHDALLLAEIGGRGAELPVDGAVAQFGVVAVRDQSGSRFGGPTQPRRAMPGSHVPVGDAAGGGGIDVPVEDGAPVRLDDFDHRLAVAHAVAADGLDDAVEAGVAGGCFERISDGFAAARDAAGAEPDADLDRAVPHAGSFGSTVSSVA